MNKRQQQQLVREALKKAFIWLNHGRTKATRLEAVQVVKEALDELGVDPYES